MTRCKSATFVLALSIVLAMPALAQKYIDVAESGNNFVEICSAIDKDPARANEADFSKIGTCLGFMSGLRDGIEMSITIVKHDEGSLQDLGVCLPDGVETGQIVHVVMKYIKENPERAHIRSAMLYVEANAKAFPCAKPVPK